MAKTHPLYGIKQRKLGRKPGPRRSLNLGAERIPDPMVAPDKPGHRLAYWIGLVARETREAHGYSLEDVASYTGVSGKTIANWETNNSRPQDEEGLVAGLAEMCDIKDPRDIYADALRKWYAQGGPPVPKRGRGGRAEASA